MTTPGRLIQETRNSYRIKRTIGMLIIVTVGLMLLAQGFTPSFFGGCWAAALVRGAAVDTDTYDPTLAIRDYGLPMWYRGVITAFAMMAMWTSFGHVTSMLTYVIFIGMFLISLVILIGGEKIMFGLGYGFARLFSRSSKRDNHPALTGEDMAEVEERQRQAELIQPAVDAANRADKMILHRAGLTWRSPLTQQEVTPNVLDRGLDDRDRAYFDAEILGGKQKYADFTNKADNIASAWGVDSVQVVKTGPNTVRIIADTGYVKPNPIVPFMPRFDGDLDTIAETPVAEYLSALTVGVDEDTREPFVMNMEQRNFMVGGMPGSGKSSFVNAIIGHAALHPDVCIAYLDEKFGAEAAVWTERLGYVASNAGGRKALERQIEFLRAAIEDMEARYGRMIQEGVTNAWTEKRRDGTPFLGPDNPVKIAIVDECSVCFPQGGPDRDLAAIFENLLQAYVERGRAAGYILMMATQYPIAENFPTVIRANVSNSVAFNVADDTAMRAILGNAYWPATPDMHPMNVSEGTAIITGTKKGDSTRRIQFSFLTGDDKRELVDATAYYRRPWLDVDAAAEMDQEGDWNGGNEFDAQFDEFDPEEWDERIDGPDADRSEDETHEVETMTETHEHEDQFEDEHDADTINGASKLELDDETGKNGRRNDPPTWRI